MHYLDALILLVSMYVGSISGGLISATLLRMPGTPASMMTTLDGYPMAQAGKPGRALGLGVAASFAGGLVSWLILALLAQPIAVLSVRLGPYDFFSLVLMALALIAIVSGDSLSKGLLSGCLGLLAAMVGMSPTGELRMTGGFTALNGGFELLPVLIGLFAVSKVFADSAQGGQEIEKAPLQIGGVLLTLRSWRRHAVNMLRSSLIGSWVGILPGIGANIGSVMAYSAARACSKDPEAFGHGSEEGIVASEAANNATVGGALIPLVALGIPGSVIDAILLGALVIHGLTPGPLLFRDNPDVVHSIVITALLANIVMAFFMWGAIRWLARLVEIPKHFLLPAVLVFCIVGSYSLNNRMFDVWVMLAFGAAGMLMERGKIPLPPFVIGFVLAPVAEKELGKGWMLHESYWPLITEPISAIFFVLSIILLAWPICRSFWKKAPK